jgi:hypothetical protein
MSVIRVLLKSLIDYAGLYPPAGLDMEASVRNYAAYRKGEHGWALGKFVLPVARLAEFEARAASVLSASDPWPLSVIGSSDPAADAKAVAAFRGRRSDARIDSLEIKAATVDDIRRASAAIGTEVPAFYEIPIAEDPRFLLDAVREEKGYAKVRTGGTKPGQVPSPEELARFLDLAQCRVAFKATAGLHHALRGVRPLTYETGCDTDVMHGFLNLLVASAVAPLEMYPYLPTILEERDIRGFQFGDATFSWHGHELTLEKARIARAGFFLSFGSCSFEEPVAELKELKLL